MKPNHTSSSLPDRAPFKAKSGIVEEILQGILTKWKWDEFYEAYKDLHMNPGLSGEETFAANTAKEFLHQIRSTLCSDGSSYQGTFEVYEDIGDAGPSVVGVMMNPRPSPEAGLRPRFVHPGPVVLLRADMDALPVQEETHVPYESKNRNVMHACGHDMHTTTLMAAVQMMVKARDRWSGTLIALFQPSEESGKGALAMLKDGLYDSRPNRCIPTPEYVMGGHVTPELAGTLSLTHGTAYSRSDSWKVTVRGKGGHGSRPEACIDPIVCLAHSIVRLQSIVSRVVPSKDAGVITVAQIQGGYAENVIPDLASMKINIRSDSDDLAELIDGEIRRVVASEVRASNKKAKVAWLAEEQEQNDANPQFESISSVPLLKNEDGLREAVSASFTDVFGKAFDGNVPGVSGSEDFPHLAKRSVCEAKPTIPLLYWRYGGTSEETLLKAGGDIQKVPSNHSSGFKPQLKPDLDNDTLKVGTQALVVAALTKLDLGGTAGFVLV